MPLIIPAQFRAGRALIGWSQEQLADAAEVGLGSVRDTESQKRPADSSAANAMRLALENEGVVFVPGREDAGPGVLLVGNRPNVIRWPTVVTKWEGVPFEIEWQGKALVVFVSWEALEDLEELTNPSDEEVLRSFHKHRGRILDAVVRAVTDRDNFDKHGRLHVRGQDIFLRE